MAFLPFEHKFANSHRNWYCCNLVPCELCYCTYCPYSIFPGCKAEPTLLSPQVSYPAAFEGQASSGPHQHNSSWTFALQSTPPPHHPSHPHPHSHLSPSPVTLPWPSQFPPHMPPQTGVEGDWIVDMHSLNWHQTWMSWQSMSWWGSRIIRPMLSL